MSKLDLSNAPNAQMLKNVSTKSTKELTNKTILNIPLVEIDENADNEKIFNMNAIKELARNIKEEGFSGAIEVYQKKDNRYEIISGHRRYRAMMLLNEKTIPAIVVQTPSETKKRRRLISSNINIREMSPLDIARALEYHFETLALEQGADKKSLRTQDNRLDILAEYFNLSVASVANYLRLNKIIDELKGLVEAKKIPWTSIYSCSELSVDKQLLIYKELMAALKGKEKLSGSEVELIVRKRNDKKKAKVSTPVSIDRTIFRIHKQLKGFALDDVIVTDKENLLKNINEIEEYISTIKAKL